MYFPLFTVPRLRETVGKLHFDKGIGHDVLSGPDGAGSLRMLIEHWDGLLRALLLAGYRPVQAFIEYAPMPVKHRLAVDLGAIPGARRRRGAPIRRAVPARHAASGRHRGVGMSWLRVEGSSQDPDLTEGLQAGVADPLWTLARQWQVAEFHGEDAASPVLVSAEVEWARPGASSAEHARPRAGRSTATRRPPRAQPCRPARTGPTWR